MAFMRAFSGSCLSLDDHDYSMPRVVARKHVLGSGEDLFDELGRPFQPQPRTLTKVFSGSALDLNATADSDSEQMSQGVSPAAQPLDRVTNTASFNDVLDNMNRNRAQAARSRGTVLVVGGAGYLASHVIEMLLREGYQVKATVADIRDKTKHHDLASMVPEAKHMLFIVETDIFNPASMRSAMHGCRFVIHCGVPHAVPGYDIVERHTTAVMALFDAAREAGGARVERIVLTGSYTNVLSTTRSQADTKSGLFDESQWNTVASRATDALSFARVSFEREARRLQELHPGAGVELVVILPAIMIGPTKTSDVSEAMRTIVDFASASKYFPVAPDITWNFVDVRDVAVAHVKAMTATGVNGQRYIVTNAALSLAELGRHIRSHYPHLTAPIYTAPFIFSLLAGPWAHSRATLRYLWKTLGVRRVLDGSKAVRELPLQLTPLTETVRDAVENLIQSGHLPAAPSGAVASESVSSLPWRFTATVLLVGVGAFVLLRKRP